jgi:hypothetical protein
MAPGTLIFLATTADELCAFMVSHAASFDGQILEGTDQRVGRILV